MSNLNPHGGPQQPQQPYAQPQQYGQPPFGQPQNQQQYQPPQFQQYQQQYQQHPQQHWQQPAAQRNSLGTAAFSFAIVAMIIMNAVSPLAMRALYRAVASSYSQFSMIMIEWGPLIISLPFLLLALGLGIAAVSPRRPARGKGLAYAAIGAASFGIVGLTLSIIFSGLAFRFGY